MLHDAPQFLIALEQSGLGAAIRQSSWAYPVANIGHIVALTLFAASVAIMDLRILGAFAGTTPASVVHPARRMAMVGLGLMALTGLMLFTAEESHVAMNSVYQINELLIALGILNALLIAGPALANIAEVPANAALPARARVAAVVSLLTWVLVAACGRLIAYF